MTPEPHPLTNAYWKIERAKEHLDALDVAVQHYVSPEPGEPVPYTITAHEEPENDSVGYRIEISQPHVYVFLIAGDAVQCLRSALDHAIWSLVRLKFPHTDPDWTEFPIFPVAPKERERFEKRLKGLNQKAIDYIESLQPYNRPAGTPIGGHLLYRLHEINRIDKHRRILVRAAMNFPNTSYFGAGPPGPDFVRQVDSTDYGYEVRRFGRYKKIEPDIATVVLFGEFESGITMPLSGLWEIYEYISNTVLPKLSGLAQQTD